LKGKMKMPEMLIAGDDLGPAKIIQVQQPDIGLRAVLVIDNVARGPAIGGMRMAPDVSVDECFRLARAMTLKNAAAGLAHGGGKSVLWGDPRMSLSAKEKLIRAFAHALRNETDYIFGPDMGTDERCMAWIKDEIGRAAGLPEAVGGIPLDEIGATGWGVAECADVAASRCAMKLKGARVAVQGYGAVGKHAMRFLARQGAILVAASDSKCTLADPKGLDVEALARLKESGRPLSDHPQGSKLGRDDVIAADCDILIPAARPDVVREDNAGSIRARLMLQGANIPCTDAAERLLHQRGVLVVPDFIANAGGVICAALEYRGSTRSAVFDTISEKIRANTAEVLKSASDKAITPREAAVEMAGARVRAAMPFRRFAIM
jgi:glutamate dehydrogenase (NAD(P)+)